MGEELLLEYGPKYWQNMEPHEVNSEGKAAAAPAASAATAPPLGAKKQIQQLILSRQLRHRSRHRRLRLCQGLQRLKFPKIDRGLFV